MCRLFGFTFLVLEFKIRDPGHRRHIECFDCKISTAAMILPQIIRNNRSHAEDLHRIPNPQLTLNLWFDSNRNGRRFGKERTRGQTKHICVHRAQVCAGRKACRKRTIESTRMAQGSFNALYIM